MDFLWPLLDHFFSFHFFWTDLTPKLAFLTPVLYCSVYQYILTGFVLLYVCPFEHSKRGEGYVSSILYNLEILPFAIKSGGLANRLNLYGVYPRAYPVQFVFWFCFWPFLYLFNLSLLERTTYGQESPGWISLFKLVTFFYIKKPYFFQ